MKAVQVQSLKGPDGIQIVEIPEPEANAGVIIEVHALGVSFPDLLISQGLYQLRSEPPFILGSEAAGIVRSAPPGSGFAPGDRVCTSSFGAFAELAVGSPRTTFPLSDRLSFAEGAALIVNYQTAVFAQQDRARLTAGESMLVMGAAGGTGTSAIQVAKAMGAGPVIGLVSTLEKGRVASEAGADHTVLATEGWKDRVRELTSGRGVDLVYDPVGGDRFLDGVRCLAPYGRLVIIGFASGTIPEIRVNRLLLGNVSLIGAAWGRPRGATRCSPDASARISIASSNEAPSAPPSVTCCPSIGRRTRSACWRPARRWGRSCFRSARPERGRRVA
jgi:NADPH2:quinone reductase